MRSHIIPKRERREFPAIVVRIERIRMRLDDATEMRLRAVVKDDTGATLGVEESRFAVSDEDNAQPYRVDLINHEYARACALLGERIGRHLQHVHSDMEATDAK